MLFPGELVLKEDVISSKLFIIIKGKIQIEAGGSILDILDKGRIVGYSDFFSNIPCNVFDTHLPISYNLHMHQPVLTTAVRRVLS